MEEEPQGTLRDFIVQGVLPIVGGVAVIAVVGDAIQRIANDGWDAYWDRGVTGFEFFLLIAVFLALAVVTFTFVVGAIMAAIFRVEDWRWTRRERKRQ